MQRINISPVEQIGHICKPTAVACLDAYYGHLLGYFPLLLHKSNSASPFPGASIRQISKKFGSMQGELLEVRQVHEILNYIGYETEEVNFINNFQLFTKKKHRNL